MVTKKKSTGEQEASKGRVKVGKLQLDKETVKDLTDSKQRQIKGGWIRASYNVCGPTEFRDCSALCSRTCGVNDPY